MTNSTMENNKVYPSEKLAKQVIQLSICDVYSPKVWVTQTHFWPMPEGTSFERCYEILSEGFSRTMTEIPALAGTLERTSSNPRDLVIKVDEDAHVEFAREDLSSRKDVPSYAALKALGFPMTDLVAKFSQPITLAPLFEGARMMTAKLNLLDGGLALMFAFNHLIVDAGTLAEIERLWSQHCTDISCGVKQNKHKPVIDEAAIRKRLSTPIAGSAEFVDEDWKVFPTPVSQLNLPTAAVTKEAAASFLEQTKKAHLASLNGNIAQTNWAIWKFSAESLAKLKKDASGQDATKWISTMDALIGLFWSRLALAKQASKAGHEKSLVLFPINIRQRVQPPIHPQYIGNAVDIVTTTHSLQELEAPDTGLEVAARCVREAVTSWTESKWASWLTMATALPDDEAICPNPLALLATHNLGFNDYSKSKSHTLDWGSVLGCIERTRYMKSANSLAACATAVIVHPRLHDGGLEVATTSTKFLKETLEKDDVFSSYAELVTFYS